MLGKIHQRPEWKFLISQLQLHRESTEIRMISATLSSTHSRVCNLAAIFPSSFRQSPPATRSSRKQQSPPPALPNSQTSASLNLRRTWDLRPHARLGFPGGRGGGAGAALIGFTALASFSVSAATPSVLRMASSGGGNKGGDEEKQPEDFRYYQIYASEDGTTHFKECRMHGFDLKAYASSPQYVRSDFGGEPTKIVFSELAPGLEQSLHSCPQVQFVVTLSGSWYVKTSDGTRHEFKAGDVLFQDNTKDSPAQNQPQHYSGVVGNKPCQQLIVQLSRTPEVNNPDPFK